MLLILILLLKSCGFTDGIWVCWNSSDYECELITLDEQLLNVIVRGHRRRKWMLTTIYASPKPHYREPLWHYLKQLGDQHGLSWLMIGDFNQVPKAFEKKGGRGVN